MGRSAPHRALAGIANHGDDDVWLRRRIAAPRESFRTYPADTGRYRRVHIVHTVDVRGGEYRAGEKSAGSDSGGLSEDAGGEPAVSRQYRSYSVELAYDGNQGLPGGIAIWRGRRGKHFD